MATSRPVILEISGAPDLARMRRDRTARLQASLAAADVDALVLLGSSNVTYATGASWPLSDAGRANVEQPVAVVVAGDDSPHLFTPFAEDALGLDLGDDHLHGPVYLDLDEGVEIFGEVFAGLVPTGASVAVDELTGAMRRNHKLLFGDTTPGGADEVMGPARIIKTPDELACIRRGLRITEQAMADVQAALAPGRRQIDLTARFLHRVFELGADANVLDPIWQVMPATRAEMPWTTHGDIPCPLQSTERELTEGDIVWVDAGITCDGYHSDFGRTWVVGREPTAREQRQFRTWREINDAVLSLTRAGVTSAQLTRAAMAVCDGAKPWMPHFYLSHSLGVETAEMPFIGTDLGDDFDAGFVLAAGMVVVIEPIVWDEGASGYRSENVHVVTEDGCTTLSDYPYEPYGD
jgi:Xaa-Pro aminopeptidase